MQQLQFLVSPERRTLEITYCRNVPKTVLRDEGKLKLAMLQKEGKSVKTTCLYVFKMEGEIMSIYYKNLAS